MTLTALLMLLIVSLIGAREGFHSSLALEQEVRCGTEEHIHSRDCYVGDVLVCGQKTHFHSEHCYLVLLEDNDINWLLYAMDASEDKSLESVLHSAVAQALKLNVSAEQGAQAVFLSNTVTLDSTSISALNTTITEYEIDPPVVLNEGLTTMLDTLVTTESGVQTAAEIVDDSASSNTDAANFYIYFVDENGNGSWSFIGTETYTTVQSGKDTRYYGISTNTIINLINETLGIEYDSLPTTYYATSSASTSWTQTGTVSGGRPDETQTVYTTFDTAESTGMPPSQDQSQSGGARYVYIGASSYNTANTQFCRVSYSFPDDYTGTQHSGPTYYTVGTTFTMPSIADGYVWQIQGDTSGTTYKAGDTITLTKSIVLEPVKSTVTVTYINKSTNETLDTTDVEPNSTQTLDPNKVLPDGYLWTYEDGSVVPTDTGTVYITEDTTFYAVPNAYTITYLNEDRSLYQVEVVPYNESHTLIALPEGSTVWLNTADNTAHTSGESVTVRENLTYKAASAYTITYVDRDGTVLYTDSYTAGAEATIRTPDSGYIWADENNTIRTGSMVLTEDLVLTAKASLTVKYVVNYSSDQVYISGETAPTVMGEETYTTAVVEGMTESIKNVSNTVVSSSMPRTDNARPGVAYFEGWNVGGDELLVAGSVYSYADLVAMAANDGDGDDSTLTLTGSWEYTSGYAVNFFVEYDSAADSTGSGDFTKVLFATYYGGTRTAYAKGTDHTVNDSLIRTLGEQTSADESWLETFPSDSYIMTALDSYALNRTDSTDGVTDKLMVDDLWVYKDGLDENNYTIQWYQLTYVSDDGNYHIDGLLVRNTDGLVITKTFAGNADAIEAITLGSDGTYSTNDDYYIKAETTNATTSDTMRDVTLVLQPKSDSSYNTESALGYTDYDASTNTYTWRISKTHGGIEWNVTEYNCTDTSYPDPYMEYAISDALGKQSVSGEYDADGGVDFTSQAYGSKFSDDEALEIGLLNIYPGTDSVILKKEDAATGQALAGAEFQLIQNGQVMKFSESEGVYTYDATAGTITTLSTGTGFLEIYVDNLDFSDGDITVHESTAPEGYSSYDDVVLTKIDGVLSIASGPDAAELKNGVLIIDNTAVTADVTVTKDWKNTEENEKRDVAMLLLANGKSVATVFPRLDNVSAEVTLTESGGYSYTWENLPAYANGTVIDWTVQEVQIGDEEPLSTGSFANWIVDYAPASVTEDGAGNRTVSLVVTNTRKEGNALTIIKVDSAGNRLAGAGFSLQLLDSNGDPSSDFNLQTGTTDNEGLLVFGDLPYGSYVLNETLVPDGHVGAGEMHFTINQDNTITITEDGGAASVSTSTDMAIVVVNTSSTVLPETGGAGIGTYMWAGSLLISAAGILLVYKILRRKGVSLSS